MKRSDFTIDPSTTLLGAVAKMNKNRSRTVMLIEDDKVTGLISEGDVLRALLRGVDVHAPAHTAVNRSFRFLTSVDEGEAFRLFRDRTFGLVPVVDEEFRLVDVITLEQVLRRARLSEGE